MKWPWRKNKTEEEVHTEAVNSLPMFNPASICIKCGWEDADMEYVPRRSFSSNGIQVENMMRTCKRCKYRWHERV